MLRAMILFTSLVSRCHATNFQSSRYTEIEEFIPDLDDMPSSSTMYHKKAEANSHGRLSSEMERKVLPPLNDQLRTREVYQLITEEAELAGYVAHWEWVPAFSSRLKASQSMRQRLEYQANTPTMSLPHHFNEVLKDEVYRQLPSMDASLMPLSVGAYFFAHYLSTYDAEPVFEYNFRNLQDKQRSELYASMLAHCVEKQRKGKAAFAHMEKKICGNIFELEKLLQQLQSSQLPKLLAMMHALIEKEQRESYKQEPLTALETLRQRFRRFSWLRSEETIPDENKEATDRRHSWPDDASCGSRIGCLKATAPATSAASFSSVAREPKDTEEWRMLRQQIAVANMELAIVLKEQLNLAGRFREAFTTHHVAVVEEALRWSKEAAPIEAKFLEYADTYFQHR